jgi:hypothetical protein
MDEYSDIWTKAKAPFDYALAFPEWWERDVEAMVVKDINHPSVIMYSIGNEIPEIGTPIGSTWGRRLAEKVRSLDDTRFVTNALNPLAAVADRIGEVIASVTDGDADLNTVIASMGEMMNRVGASEVVTTATEESASVLDVVGWNYADARHAMDRDLFPDRIVVGAETFPGHVDELWRLVREHSHVIGDFTWTGWDYLGETGIGRVDYPEEGYERSGSSGAPYPWLTAWVGDIDITSHRRPVSYYREIVFGLRSEPYIAVHRPQFHGRPTHQSPWAWSDSVSSWSWDVPAGSPVTVDVYTDADEVELLLDGRSLGTAQVGAEKSFLARFEVAYEPGELVAVARLKGSERSRTALRTATGALRVRAAADRDVVRADHSDLVYVELTVGDDAGTVPCGQDRLLSVEVTGAGELRALGSANPQTETPFGASQCSTFDGRALAIVRPTGQGEISVRVSAEGCEPVTAVMRAV